MATADFILNLAIFTVTALVTVFACFRKEGKWDVAYGKYRLRFFTMQSNILCAVSALLMCIFPQSTPVWLFKYVGTTAVTVTLLTVFLYLAPAIGKGGLYELLKGRGFFVHLVTPLMALVSFCVFEKRGMTFGQALLGMLPLVYYGPLYLYKIRFAPEGKGWEDFYGFNRNGKWKVAFAAMSVGCFLVCMALMAIQNA